MKVSELIEKLKLMNPDWEVVYANAYLSNSNSDGVDMRWESIEAIVIGSGNLVDCDD